jgi:hypothetical protein
MIIPYMDFFFNFFLPSLKFFQFLPHFCLLTCFLELRMEPSALYMLGTGFLNHWTTSSAHSILLYFDALLLVHAHLGVLDLFGELIPFSLCSAPLCLIFFLLWSLLYLKSVQLFHLSFFCLFILVVLRFELRA